MSTAVCKNCHKLVAWHAKRGVRLKDLKCPVCGGYLEAFKEDKHGEVKEWAGWAAWK